MVLLALLLWFGLCLRCLGWWGRSAGGLGPGLTSESAGAARAVLIPTCRREPGSRRLPALPA